MKYSITILVIVAATMFTIGSVLESAGYFYTKSSKTIPKLPCDLLSPDDIRRNPNCNFIPKAQ